MKIKNVKDLQNHLKKSPEFIVLERPSTTNRNKLAQFVKDEDAVIVIKGAR